MIGTAVRGITGAVRERCGVFALVTAAALLLHVIVPPVVLSVARKRADYIAFNAWLSNVPAFLASDDASWTHKLDAVRKLALFWVSAGNAYGVEWGFTVDVSDLVRFMVTSALIGAYFALWAYRRSQPVAPARGVNAAGGGVLGGFVTVLGLSTGPCSVMGCGAPVMPVVGLALAGLSSTTLKLLHDLSTIATAIVLAALVMSVAYSSWQAGAAARG